MVLGMLASVLVAGQVGAKAKPKPPAQEMKYQFLKVVKDGKELSKKELKGMVLIIKGEIGTAKRGDEVIMVVKTTKMDMNSTPWKINIKITKGEGKGKTLKGIIAMKKDGTMEVCWGKPGGKRPKKFESKKGSGHLYEVLKPVKTKKEKD
jgi:uncharacterized protein (TIGR03067 family)